ncbi:hypothetical protein CIK76_17565 [Glutamicibacter sp. BW80]|uniref:hypothetical protein n=1 Tax=unclassified Glutamicibacter TaxID=2627139 RepID=UPI000BB9A3EA|nr:hypothetical protein [Glutamicibacter sp. BW80]PCC27292.1 hypothetical protein CIK76_17565 [Glutamicibacter sp. BW80]
MGSLNRRAAKSDQQTSKRAKGDSPLIWIPVLRTMFYKAIFVAVMGTILVLLSATGLLTTNHINEVQRDGAWSGIAVAMCALLFTFLGVDSKRPDSGLPAKGLPQLLMLSTLAAVLLMLIFMISWPIAVDQNIYGTTVAAWYISEPLAFGLSALFVIASFFWSSLALLGMTASKMPCKLLGYVFLFAVAGIGMWLGSGLFMSPPAEANLALWIVLAALGIALQPIVGFCTGRRIQRQLASK